MAELVKSERVDGPDGARVQVLFYDDESIRFRIYESPLVIEEAFLTGQKDHSIIKVGPRVRPVDIESKNGDAEGRLRVAEELLRQFLARFYWLKDHPDYFEDVRKFVSEKATAQ